MKNNERLLSLDVLRGIDLMLLVGLQPILRSFLIELDSPLLNETLLYHLDHAEWEGLRAWDLVMPLFLFMSGVTMPYSLPKYKSMAKGNKEIHSAVLARHISPRKHTFTRPAESISLQQHSAGHSCGIPSYRTHYTLP